MKVFISWSGERSKNIAGALNWFLPRVINTIEPWISSEGIDPGSRWSADVASQLEKTNYGIICLVSDNLNSPWIHFEAGALSKFVEKSYVVPYLFDIEPKEVQGPLAQFQAKKANKVDTRVIINMIFSLCAQNENLKTSKDIILDGFEKYWGDFEVRLNSIAELPIPKAQQRQPDDLLNEILGIVRSLKQDEYSSTKMINKLQTKLTLSDLNNDMFRDFMSLDGEMKKKKLPHEYLREYKFFYWPDGTNTSEILVDSSKADVFKESYINYLIEE